MAAKRRDSSEPAEHGEEVQRRAEPRAAETPAGLAGAALGLAGNAAMARLLAGPGSGGTGSGGPVHRDAATATEGGSLDQGVAEQIAAARGGSPLPAPVREPLSRQLGADLGHVRVHTDAAADGLSRSVRAQAFTSGADIFFSSGSFQPSSTAGRELIAHEAVHVVQQGVGGSAPPARAATTVSDPADAAETEAYHLAPLLARGIDHPAATDVAAPEASRSAVVHRAPPGPAPAPVDPNAQATTPAFEVEWTWVIKYGSLNRELDRTENLIWVGDNLAVFARVSVPHAKDLGLRLQYAGVGIGGSAGDAAVTTARWIDDRTAMWEISGTTPGKRFMGFTVANSEWGNERENNFDLTVAGDHTVFKRRCTTAETMVNTRYAAGREWFMNTFLAYKAGYDRQSAALERQAGADRLVGELLLGVLFAGLGGAAGGAVANLGRVAKAAEVLKKSNAVASGAFTDTAKDLAKYVARIPTRLGGGASVGTAGAGPSTDPAAAGVAQGQGSAAAVDPLNWMATLDAKISGERATIGALLLAANLKADAIAVNQPTFAFDFDPVEVIETYATIDGKSIDALGEVPTSLEYERACWEVWLANYAYKLDFMPDSHPYGMSSGTWSTRENVGGKLEEEIDRVAGTFGEKGEDWIKRYGGPLKAQLDAEAAAINKAMP